MDDPVWVELRAKFLKSVSLVALDVAGHHFHAQDTT